MVWKPATLKGATAAGGCFAEVAEVAGLSCSSAEGGGGGGGGAFDLLCSGAGEAAPGTTTSSISSPSTAESL